ncbi:MAG: ABC transporter permease [Flavobacteriales bacterium]|nr:ABC transporter permease [Flavobacteriales bacterium]
MLKENIKVALHSIRSQMLRTVLTIFIIALGITALVSILTLVAAFKNTLSSDFSSMGANGFNIRQYEMEVRIGNGRRQEREKINPIISYPDIKAFKEKYYYPLADVSSFFVATSNAEVKYDNQKTDPEITIVGADEFYAPNSGLEFQFGRNFTPFEVNNNQNVCVLGSDFMKGLFQNINPIDKIVSIRGNKFRVVGVLKEKGSTFGNSQDLRVIIPLQIARSIYTQPNINYNLRVNVLKQELLGDAINEATLVMRQIRKLNPVEENNFGIQRSDELINQILSITIALNVAAIAIGIITIFGSSIALMNIMLVSVSERTREIGIRKALGAKRSTIAMQFFTETVVVGQLGGFVGIILGMLIGYGVANLLDFVFVVPWGAMIAAVIVSFLVAVISGLFPAIKAAKQDPIESLRYE